MAIRLRHLDEALTSWVRGVAGSARSELELTFVIPLAEAVMRVWYHLNPRVYKSAWRIRTTTPGRMPAQGERYVLLVLFARHKLPAYTRNLFDAIARAGLNLVVVSNAKLTPAFREELLGCSHLLIERDNLGRDFGAYKDGIEIVRERFPGIERLILMNDSLFYFEKGLDRMLADLCLDYDLIGTTETFEHHYHIQSFILSFSRALLNNPRFQKYWRRYRPISTRRWAIHRGEVGFTKKMMKAGIRPLILYHGAALVRPAAWALRPSSMPARSGRRYSPLPAATRSATSCV